MTLFDNAQWRLASKTDRNTIGVSTVSFLSSLSSRFYSGDATQTWHIAESAGVVKFKSDFWPGKCLAVTNGAVGLMDCQAGGTGFAVTTKRARTVERPAVYSIKAGAQCLKPDLAKGIVLAACDATADWYVEPAMGDRRLAPEYEVKSLLIVKPFTDAMVPDQAFLWKDDALNDQGFRTPAFLTYVAQSTVPKVPTKGTMPTGAPAAVADAYLNRLVKMYAEVTDGRVLFTPTVVTSNTPLTSFQSHMGTHLPNAWTMQDDVGKSVPIGKYDAVQVYFTQGDGKNLDGSRVQGGWGWSPGASAASNFTLWTTVNGVEQTAQNWQDPTATEPFEVFVHEPMHGYDGFAGARGVPIPDGALHGGANWNYTAERTVGFNSNLHIYHDYWLGQVIQSDDTYAGFGPRLFRQPPPRDVYAPNKIVHAQSGKCLSLPSSGANVVLTSDCSNANAVFQRLGTDVWKHKATGQCLHPNGGTAGEGVNLIFWSSTGCDPVDRIQYVPTLLGSLKNNLTGMCLKPLSGNSAPPEGSPIVFSAVCDQPYQKFNFVRVP